MTRNANEKTRFSNRARLVGLLPLLTVLSGLSGCGTTRMTDTQRTGQEQLLISNAIDQAINQFDFRLLDGKTVYFDTQYLEGTVDKGYLISSLRQHLLASGCVLQEERTKASYVVEVRSGGVGTDRHSVLVGIPQTTVPALIPGQPTMIPEIPFAKKTDQNGVAKVAVFAYNRRTGHPVWQSGVVQSKSSAKDLWLLGTGPFQNGTIRDGTVFAGEPIPLPAFTKKTPDETSPSRAIPVTRAAAWPDHVVPTPEERLAEILGSPVRRHPHPYSLDALILASVADTPDTGASAAKSPKAEKSTASGNSGGQAETAPTDITDSGGLQNPDLSGLQFKIPTATLTSGSSTPGTATPASSAASSSSTTSSSGKPAK